MSDDQFLCYCTQTTRKAFFAAIAANPSIGFDALCESTRVGSQCTACLLNAEDAFVEGGTQAARAASARGSEGAVRKAFRHRVFDVLDRIAPHAGHTYTDRVPVIGGNGIETRVVVSNAVPSWGQLAPSPYRLTVTLLDESGKQIDRDEAFLKPGEWFDRDVSSDLPRRSDGLALGTCIVAANPTKRGYRGAARPHFSITTPRSTAALHAQGAKGVLATGIGTIIDNPQERQFLFLADYSGSPNEASITIRPDDDDPTPAPFSVPIAPGGVVLAALPISPRARPATMQAISISAKAPVKVHFVITDRDFARISIDHI